MIVADTAKLQAVWERTHKNKIHYGSQQEARHALREIKKKFSAGRLEAYPCKICGKYVLGTSTKKNKKK